MFIRCWWVAVMVLMVGLDGGVAFALEEGVAHGLDGVVGGSNLKTGIRGAQ